MGDTDQVSARDCRGAELRAQGKSVPHTQGGCCRCGRCPSSRGGHFPAKPGTRALCRLTSSQPPLRHSLLAPLLPRETTVLGVLESRALGGHSSWVMETQNLQSICREKEQGELF